MDNQFFNSPLFLALVTAFFTLMANDKIRAGFFKQLDALLELGRKHGVDKVISRVQLFLSLALLVLLSVITIQLLVIDVFEPSLKRKALAVSLWICGYLSYKLTRKMRAL